MDPRSNRTWRPAFWRAGCLAVAVLVVACSSGPTGTSEDRPTATPVPSTSASAPPSASPSVVTPTPAPPTPLPSAPTAEEPEWVAAAAMVIPRRSHSATLLADGRVLVVGGYDGDGEAVTLAEVYDPTSETWTPAGSLRHPRSGHTATLLPDGTVLVVGGWTPADELRPTTSTERYDPATGTWTAGPDLHDVRAGHTASLLQDGSVLVAGGARYNGGNGDPGASVEILRPGARTWAMAAPMRDARGAHTATVLADGRVLVVGGIGRETEETGPFNTTLRTTERYDPTTDTWTPTGPLVDGRAGHTAVLLVDGRVLVSRMGREGSAVMFEPTEGTFSTTGDLINGRFWHTSTRLPDGAVLVVGGDPIDDSVAGRLAERYDPDRGTWSPTAAMAGARTGHAATDLADGRVMVSGGAGPDGELVAIAEVYVPPR